MENISGKSGIPASAPAQAICTPRYKSNHSIISLAGVSNSPWNDERRGKSTPNNTSPSFIPNFVAKRKN